MAQNPYSITNLTSGIQAPSFSYPSLGSNDPKKKFLKNVGTPTGMSVLPSNTGATNATPPPVAQPPTTTPRDAFVSNQVADGTQPSGARVGTAPTAPTASSPFVNPNSELTPEKADPNASYRSAFDSYLKSLQPSTEETQARKYLTGLLDTSRREEQTALERGETLGFASGEAARVGRNRAFDIQAASDALSGLTGQRTATTEAEKARLDFEKSLLGEESEAIKVGDSLVKLNPETGEYEEVFSAPQQAEGVTLSPGQVRFERDPETGELRQVASGGTRPPSETEIGKALERQEKDEASRATQVTAVNAINNILASDQLGRISGVSGRGFLGGTVGTGGLRSQLAQIKSLTSLTERDKLKGTGAISDFEAGMLANSANALNFAIQDDGTIRMSDREAEQNLKNIRGVLLAKTGTPVTITATDPATGESLLFEDMTRQDIEDAVLQGYLIDYM